MTPFTLLYGVFSYCNGLRQLCEGMLGCEGKLNHLGFDKAPARNTLNNANTKRSYLSIIKVYTLNSYNNIKVLSRTAD
ncbi:MAG: DUF4372 domain-containing protein [Ferruginibacter sp.]